MAMSNVKRRRFQSTGFGLDREAGDKLPPWKRKMFSSMRNRAKQSRHQLLAALNHQKSSSSSMSPNSKKKHANSTIDSFRKAFVENEMKLQFEFSSSTPAQNGSNGSTRVNQSQSQAHSQQGAGFMADEDVMVRTLSPEQYKTIFAELASYLEQTELSDLRAAHLASLEEFEQDEERHTMAELSAEAADTCCCPLCSKHELHIEYVSGPGGKQLPVYGCEGCGGKFRPRDASVMTGAASEVAMAAKMLAALKGNLGGLMGYHAGQLGCRCRLNFGVVDGSGLLQAWCTQCSCNEIVI